MATPTAQELNQKLIFKTASGSRNAVTGIAKTLTTVATMWARVSDLGGDIEQTEQSEHAQRKRYEIWTRWSDSITGFQQIVWGTKTLIITSAPQQIIDGSNRYWMMVQAEHITEE